MATSNPGRKAAAAAARSLMSDKIKAVEVLADAIDAHRAAQDEIDRAIERANDKATTAREKHDAAREAGWSAAELRKIGLEPPAAPRRRRDSEPGTDNARPNASTENASTPPAVIDITSAVPASADAQAS